MAELARIHPGDIVEVNVKGRKALAYAEMTIGQGKSQKLSIDPITPGFGWRTVTGRQVISHWRKTKNVPKVRTRHQQDDGQD